MTLIELLFFFALAAALGGGIGFLAAHAFGRGAAVGVAVGVLAVPILIFVSVVFFPKK